MGRRTKFLSKVTVSKYLLIIIIMMMVIIIK